MIKINNIEFLECLKTGRIRNSIIGKFNYPEGLVDFAKNTNNQIYGCAIIYDKLYLFYRKKPSILELLRAQDKESNNNLQHKGLCGIIDTALNEIIPPRYVTLEHFMNDIIEFESVDGLYGLIRLSGEIVLDSDFEKIHPYSESLFAVCKEGKVGFMDFRGKMVIPLDYKDTGEVFRFANGLACVAKTDSDGIVKYGYINHNNEIILPFIFKDCKSFDNCLTLNNLSYKDFSVGRFDYPVYSISIDGTMVENMHTNEYTVEPDYEGITHYGFSGSEGDRLDAYEGDESNYWNTD